MIMKKITIPKFNIGEEYGLHEFDLIPLGEVIADNNLAYYMYKYRKIRKIKIYLFYNCDILSAFYTFDNNNKLLNYRGNRKFKRDLILDKIDLFCPPQYNNHTNNEIKNP